SGPGILEEAWPNLFRPFATFGKKNGLGLGLALSRQTLLDSGGDLWWKRNLRAERASLCVCPRRRKQWTRTRSRKSICRQRAWELKCDKFKRVQHDVRLLKSASLYQSFTTC